MLLSSHEYVKVPMPSSSARAEGDSCQDCLIVRVARDSNRSSSSIIRVGDNYGEALCGRCAVGVCGGYHYGVTTDLCIGQGFQSERT